MNTPGTDEQTGFPRGPASLDAVQRIGGFGLWQLDLSSGAIKWSYQAALIYGTRHDRLPTSLPAFLAGIETEDRSAAELAFAALRRDGIPLDLVYAALAGAGPVRHARIRAEVVQGPDGRIVEALGTVEDVTQARARDDALRASEARLASVFAAMVEGVVVQDATGRVIDANDAAGRILGLTRAQLLGRTSLDPEWRSVHEDGTPFPGESHPAMIALRTGEVVEDRLMGVIAPGLGQRWISITAVPLADIGRIPHTVVTTFVDVTQRLHDRARLSAKAAKLRDLYDHAPCGYHSIDRDGRFVDINETGLSWLGCSRSQVVGVLGPADFMDADGRARMSEGLSRLVDGAPEVAFELDLHGRDGTVRRVAGQATAVRDAAGRFVMSRTAMHDVTTLRNIERTLRRQTIEQRLMLDNDLVGIVKLRNRRAVWLNRAMARIFGYEPGELDGQPVRLLHRDDETYEQVIAAIHTALDAGERPRHQVEMRRKDGAPVWIDVIGVRMEDGTADSLWMLTDITAIKHGEAERLRTARLEAENDHLLSANRLKSQFLSSMSHELRTPLNSIIGFTDLIRIGAVRSQSPQFDEFLDYVGTSGRHLLRMIETILDFASTQASTTAFEAVTSRLEPLVRESVQTLAREAADKAIHVTWSVDPAQQPVEVDPVRLKQVLHAYLSNAIKFTPREGRVTLSVRPEGADAFRIEVADTGVGIAAADLPRLFMEFHQIEGLPGGRPAGIGMGLALSRSLVEAQGGTVGVRSEPGAGSVFHVVLPARPAPRIEA